jgi:hypothetical protein
VSALPVPTLERLSCEALPAGTKGNAIVLAFQGGYDTSEEAMKQFSIVMAALATAALFAAPTSVVAQSSGPADPNHPGASRTAPQSPAAQTPQQRRNQMGTTGSSSGGNSGSGDAGAAGGSAGGAAGGAGAGGAGAGGSGAGGSGGSGGGSGGSQ